MKTTMLKRILMVFSTILIPYSIGWIIDLITNPLFNEQSPAPLMWALGALLISLISGIYVMGIVIYKFIRYGC